MTSPWSTCRSRQKNNVDAKLAQTGHRYYLYQPGQYIDMYEDPASRHWLVPGGGPDL
jgi:hypothetical protein